ncbi:restriction endonuclease subunit S [Paenibacillus sp. NPDC057934]|uniref:restriction endonuclease subunit S n=1 Tax=Paenibacillus sp. NPDC057934 TaxID=3346282 RepID=UPI0036D91E4D
MIRLKTYKFNELYKMSSGISSKPEQAGYGSPFLSFSTIFNNYFLPDKLPDAMNTSKEEQENYSIRKGDVFLTRTSETLGELAMSSVSLKDYPKATFSGFAKRLRPIQKDITYDKFMGFYLRSEYFRKIINNNATMTLRASFNENIFSYIKVQLPDYQTQVQIGNLLYNLEEKKALNDKINKELESLAKTIYDYWFVQFDFPNEEGKPYKTSGGKMVWNETLKQQIPEGWSNGTLSDIGDIIGGSTPSKKNSDYFSSNGTAWITPRDLSMNLGNKFIVRGNLDVSDLGIKAASLKIMPKGTVLLSSRAPIGYMAVANGIVTTNQGFKSFVPKKNYSTPFMFYAIKNSLPEIIKNASGSTFKEVSGSVLKTIKITLPPKSIISNYTKKVSSIFERQSTLELENNELTGLRDWLLPMLINGQVKFR